LGTFMPIAASGAFWCRFQRVALLTRATCIGLSQASISRTTTPGKYWQSSPLPRTTR
jgi:hypothetical protein